MSGEEDPETLHAANNLAGFLAARNDLQAGRDLAQGTLERSRRTLGPDDSMTLATANNLAWILADLGETEQARQLAGDTAT